MNFVRVLCSALVVVSLGFAAERTALAGTVGILAEDWESGISTQKWQIFGVPEPALYTGGDRLGEASLINNGDSWYESGVVSRDPIVVRPGLRVCGFRPDRTPIPILLGH